MVPSALIPWLDPEALIHGFGPYALIGVCFIIFAETGLLVGFLLPGDTLLVITGLLAFHPGIGVDVWWAALAIGISAFLGGEVGYLIGHKFGPTIFEKKESGLFSRKNVERTNAFFERFGALAIVLARFVPIVRTFAPVAAGVGHMNYKKYSLYNLVGAIVWGIGLTLAGYLLGYIPPIAMSYWNFRLMMGAGFFAMAAAAWVLFATRKDRVPMGRWVQALIVLTPLATVFGHSFGWIFTEVGRQPWVVFGEMTTKTGVSPSVGTGDVWTSMIVFTLLYGALAVVEIRLLLEYIRRGPDPFEEPRLVEEDEPLEFAY